MNRHLVGPMKKKEYNTQTTKLIEQLYGIQCETRDCALCTQAKLSQAKQSTRNKLNKLRIVTWECGTHENAPPTNMNCCCCMYGDAQYTQSVSLYATHKNHHPTKRTIQRQRNTRNSRGIFIKLAHVF